MKYIHILFFVFYSQICFSQTKKPSDYGIKSKKALEFYNQGDQQVKWKSYKKAVELFFSYYYNNK